MLFDAEMQEMGIDLILGGAISSIGRWLHKAVPV